jgi:hypothetical protein
MIIKLTDENSRYLGDGAYAHTDRHGRLWVVTYDGRHVTSQVCLDDDGLASLWHYRYGVKPNPSRSVIADECSEIIEIQLIRLYKGQIGVDPALEYILGTIRGDK